MSSEFQFTHHLEGQKYDASKLVDYPGFNSPIPPGFQDEFDRYCVPPLSTHQSKKEFLKSLQKNTLADAEDNKQSAGATHMCPNSNSSAASAEAIVISDGEEASDAERHEKVFGGNKSADAQVGDEEEEEEAAEAEADEDDMCVVDDASLLASDEPAATAGTAKNIDVLAGAGAAAGSSSSAQGSTAGGGPAGVESTPRVLGVSKYRPLQAGSCVLAPISSSDANLEAGAAADADADTAALRSHSTDTGEASEAAHSGSSSRPLTRPSIEAFAKGIGAHELTVERPSESSGRFTRLMCHIETLVRHSGAQYAEAAAAPRLFSPNSPVPTARKRAASPRIGAPAASSTPAVPAPSSIPPHKRTKTE